MGVLPGSQVVSITGFKGTRSCPQRSWAPSLACLSSLTPCPLLSALDVPPHSLQWKTDTTRSQRSGTGVPTVDTARGSGHSLSPGKHFFPVSKVVPWARSERTRFRVFPLSALTELMCRTSPVLSRRGDWETVDFCCLFPPYWGKKIHFLSLGTDFLSF